jgi:penicillin-binding protein 1A
LFCPKIKSVLFFFASIIFVVCVAVISVLFFYGRLLPSELSLLYYAPPAMTRIYSSDNALVNEYAIERRIIVDFENIPNIIRQAFLIAEDREFYEHAGVSVQSLLRAITENTSKKLWNTKPAGGSTITQQVAKNLLVGNEKSISRKIKEAIMAFRIESSISKDKIFEIYLNHLYLGKGCYGIVEACRYYFDKDITKITPTEAAFLAALPSAPSVYLNMKDKSKVIIKRNAILTQMHDSGLITKLQLHEALLDPVIFKSTREKHNGSYFSEEIRRICTKYIPDEYFFTEGYNIITSMDRKLQSIAQKCLEDGLIAYSNKYEKNNATLLTGTLQQIKKNLPRTVNEIVPVRVMKNCGDNVAIVENASGKSLQIKTHKKLKKDAFVLCRKLDDNSFETFSTPEVTGGIVVMDASNGDILALSGGYSPDVSSFNCATQAKRQPGSTIKPFVYVSALEDGFDENDEVEDKRITIKLADGSFYSPRNYGPKIYGKMPMREALIHSRNLATINLAQKVGHHKITKTLRAFGLIDNNFNISYVLGSCETTLLQLVTAFSAILNEGEIVVPRFIKRILDRSYSQTKLERLLCKTRRSRKVISSETANIIKNILRDTAKYGTAAKLAQVFSKFNIDVGGKTGTTNECKDAWFVGYITKNQRTIIVGIFVGYKIPKSLGEHASGAQIALPIFCNFLERFCEN